MAVSIRVFRKSYLGLVSFVSDLVTIESVLEKAFDRANRLSCRSSKVSTLVSTALSKFNTEFPQSSPVVGGGGAGGACRSAPAARRGVAAHAESFDGLFELGGDTRGHGHGAVVSAFFPKINRFLLPGKKKNKSVHTKP